MYQTDLTARLSWINWNNLGINPVFRRSFAAKLNRTNKMLLLRARTSNNTLNANPEQQKIQKSSLTMIDDGKQDRIYISSAQGGAPGESQSTSSGIRKSNDDYSHLMELSTTQAVAYPSPSTNYTSYYQPNSYNEQQNTIFRETMNEGAEFQQGQLRPTNYSPVHTGYYANSYQIHSNNATTMATTATTPPESMNPLHPQQVMPIVTIVPTTTTVRSGDGIEFPLVRGSCASQSTTAHETSYESL